MLSYFTFAGVQIDDDPETSGLSALSLACSAARRSRYNFCQELGTFVVGSLNIMKNIVRMCYLLNPSCEEAELVNNAYVPTHNSNFLLTSSQWD